ncbi:MAG: hypothetical protein M3680_10975 [Myxococcota bacterium]|nr:hypothetical protein [Myxococcota bacterium]
MRADPLAALLPDRPAPTSVTAAKQVRQQLQHGWQDLVTASRSYGRWRVVLNGVTRIGDWVVHVGRYSYLLDGGAVRCTVQWAHGDAPAYLTCGHAHAELRWSAATSVAPLHLDGTVIGRVEVSADARQPRLDVALLARLSRAIARPQLAIKIDRAGIGRAVVETIVSAPPGPAGRQSWRYAVDVTLTTTGFAAGVPRLLERYAETCIGIHGCHALHWNCQRAK